MDHRRIPALAALGLTAGAIAWALAGVPGTPTPCPATGGDCESPGTGLIRQPANTWSSLALATAGIGVLAASPGGAGEAARQPASRGGGAPTAVWSALALVFAGDAAFLFHASHTAWTARLDGIAVGVLLAVLALHLRHVRGRGLALPGLLVALGGLCWGLGHTGGPWCRPSSLLQAHAAWHLLAGAGLWLWLRRRGARSGSPGPA